MAEKAKQAGAFVRRKIVEMRESWDKSTARAVRAALARLRRGVGKAPGSMPELWGATLGGLPLELVGTEPKPSYGEWAVYTALTLYALHQQGKDPRDQCMSREGESLGTAVRRLAAIDENREAAVTRRFSAAVTADSFEEFTHHLRGLIELLKAHDLPIDYPALAEDLYRFRIPVLRDGVRLQWGRDFYRLSNDEIQSKKAQ